MPEIAAIGFVGAVVTFLAVNFNLYWVHRSFQKPEYLTLNHNLLKVNRYWSLEQGQLVELLDAHLFEDAKKKDYQKATRSAFLFGTMMIFLSWLGLLIFFVYFFSMNKFAKSRMETRIYSSELIKSKDLSQNEVQRLLLEFESWG